MTAKDTLGVYRPLLKQMREAGVYAVARADGGFRYQRRGSGAVIWVHRSVGRTAYNIDADEFLAGVEDLAHECVSVAHEYGHHLSAEAHTQLGPNAYQARMDAIEGRVKADRPVDARVDDANAVWWEEHRAWELARDVLNELGFTEWPRFHEAKAEAIEGYSEGCRRVNGWKPLECEGERNPWIDLGAVADKAPRGV